MDNVKFSESKVNESFEKSNSKIALIQNFSVMQVTLG